MAECLEFIARPSQRLHDAVHLRLPGVCNYRNAHGQHDLANLADVGLLRRQEEVTRELHRDGAAALLALAGLGKTQGGATQPHQVDALVREEPAVLRGHEGLADLAPDFGAYGDVLEVGVDG